MLTLAVILMVGCDPDSGITTPTEVDNSVYLMTLSGHQVMPNSYNYVAFGKNVAPLDPWLGLDWLASDGGQSTPRAVILEPGEFISLGMIMASAPWLRSHAEVAPSYHYFSDWSTVSSSAQNGVTEDEEAEVSLLVQTYQADDYSLVSREVVSRKFTGSAIAGQEDFPLDDHIRGVFLRQIRRFGCHGDGEITIRSRRGITVITEGSYEMQMVSIPVQETTISCTRYESITAAQAALARFEFQP